MATVTYNGQGQRNYLIWKHVNSTDIHSNSISIFIHTSVKSFVLHWIWNFCAHTWNKHFQIAYRSNNKYFCDRMTNRMYHFRQSFKNFSISATMILEWSVNVKDQIHSFLSICVVALLKFQLLLWQVLETFITYQVCWLDNTQWAVMAVVLSLFWSVDSKSEQTCK